MANAGTIEFCSSKNVSELWTKQRSGQGQAGFEDLYNLRRTKISCKADVPKVHSRTSKLGSHF